MVRLDNVLDGFCVEAPFAELHQAPTSLIFKYAIDGNQFTYNPVFKIGRLSELLKEITSFAEDGLATLKVGAVQFGSHQFSDSFGKLDNSGVGISIPVIAGGNDGEKVEYIFEWAVGKKPTGRLLRPTTDRNYVDDDLMMACFRCLRDLGYH
jgi:hypothetical protein